MIAEIVSLIIVTIVIVIPFIGIYIVDMRIEDTMPIKEEQKIIKLFKKYGIEQTRSEMTTRDRYTELDGIIGDTDKEIRIEVRKEKFKIVFEIEPDLSMQNELGISSITIRKIKTFNKVFKNGIIEYFEKEMKIKNKLNKINEINSSRGEYEC